MRLAEVAERDCDRQLHDAGGDHLDRGGDECVCRQRQQPRAVEGPARPGEREGERSHEPDQRCPRVIGRRQEQQRDAREADQRADQHGAPHALAREQAEDDHPERRGRGDHRRDVGGNARLDQRDAADAADQEPAAEHRRADHLTTGRALPAAECDQEGDEQRAGEQEADRAGEHRWDRLDHHADREIGRSPDDVHRRHRGDHREACTWTNGDGAHRPLIVQDRRGRVRQAAPPAVRWPARSA